MTHPRIEKYTIAALLMAGVAAQAANAEDAPSRWYATATVGLGTLSSATLTYADGNNTDSANAEFEASFAGGGALGYRFDNGWSVEGELMYRRNDMDPVDLAGLGSFTEGDFASLGIGVNALYNFAIGDSGKLTGYFGPGIVYLQEIDIDFDQAGQQEISFETDDTALQLKLGGRFDISERWFVEAGATWFVADSVKLELPADRSQTLKSDYEHLNFQIGAGWRF